MEHFLQSFQFDRISFWLGFAAASLLWWLLGKLRRPFASLVTLFYSRAKSARQNITTTTDVRLRNDMIRFAQNRHIAAPLFSLDEILIPPLLQAPPAQVEPGAPPEVEFIAAQVVPYLPACPDLAAVFHTPTFSLAEALSNGANLILTGQPGSGKSTALAHLAIAMARSEELPGDLSSRLPLLIDALDLLGTGEAIPADLEGLLAALHNNTSTLTQARLPGYLESVLSEGSALLLLDELDALPPTSVDKVVTWLSSLLERFPRLQVVAAASPGYFGKLPRMGFLSLGIAGWDQDNRAAFIQRWSDLWAQTAPSSPPAAFETDPALLIAWLREDLRFLNPLEMTLAVWAAFAGDALGPGAIPAIEAYIRRMLALADRSDSIDHRLVLERTALWCLTESQPAFTPKSLDESSAPAFAHQPGASADILDPNEEQEPQPVSSPGAHPTRQFPALQEIGFLRGYGQSAFTFSHPVILCYLAACAAQQLGGLKTILRELIWFDHPVWDVRSQMLGFLAARSHPGGQDASKLLEFNQEPLQELLLNTGEWLKFAKSEPWQPVVMRALANLIQNETFSLSTRARATTALVKSGDPGMSALLLQMARSRSSIQRQLAALGYGLQSDPKSVDALHALLADPAPNVYRSACLALVASGSQKGLEYTAEALLHGSEDLRRAAAEALSTHPEEGLPSLKEGSTIDDLLIRRAVVYGLERLGTPWAVAILEKMQIEDTQWVVKNAATQALERINQPNPRIPKPLPLLKDSPWLISFAGEKGVGVLPGKAGYELLLQAVKEGKEEQQLAAIYFLQVYGDSAAVLPLYQILYGKTGELREAAQLGLQIISSTGIELPSPDQFGFGSSS